MDPLALLLDIVAVAVYPGGLFLVVLAVMVQRSGGLPRTRDLDARAIVAVIAAMLAASMSPVPGSPAASLPPAGGATPNLVAAILLLFVGASLAAPEPWSVRRMVAGGLGGASLVLLGLIAASFSVAMIAGGAGGEGLTARILAAATALIAMPIVVQPYKRGAGAVGRVAVASATVEFVLALLIPPSLQWPATLIAVGALAGGAGLYGLLLRATRALTRREYPGLVALAAACCAAAAVAAVIAARP
ncbi:MAG TPA: hypothetical protein VMU65_06840 [Candidatus Saccharimonadales bacterium]|nr:hypothetical protein [Candidatus Saccharimonadales bacterium]